MKQFWSYIFLSICLAISSASGQSYIYTSDTLYVDFKPKELKLEWISPSNDSILISKSGEVQLQVRVTADSEIAQYEIFNNGKSSESIRGLGVVKRSDIYGHVISHSLMLDEGANFIEFRVDDEVGQEVFLRRLVFYKERSFSNARRDYALIFATNDYDEWGDLSNPVFDAKTVSEELEMYYGFDVELVLNPTIDSIRLKLREYSRRNFIKDDQLLIFFAGHGHFDEVDQMGLLVGSNSKIADETKNSYINYPTLRRQVDNISCDHILLVMDVCFGGTFDPIIARSGLRGGENQYKGVTDEDYIRRKMKAKTRQFVTSGGKEYVPDGNPGSHSPFASKFIEALRSYGGNDDVLSINELKIYLERVQPEPRYGSFGSNEPGSDFLFISRKSK